MTYGFYHKDNRTDRERYLEDELERMRDDEERARDERRRQREERREETQRQIEYSNRTASTWPEALRKQSYLFDREANEAGEYDIDHYFSDGAAACRRGLEIWKEVEASRQEAIAELERQIEAIKASIKIEVVERLDAESNGRKGWHSLAISIAQTDDDDLNRFLDW